MVDRQDYILKRGAYKRPVRVANTSESKLGKLRCKNYGCNMFFDENENHDGACRHHTAPPIFHDRVKGWSCCREKKAYDWEEFKLIEGCAVGKHSTVEKPQLFTSSPTVDAANAAEARSASAQLKQISDFNQENPNASTAAASAQKTVTTRKSSRKSDGTAKCQNKGCQKSFVVNENKEDSCRYHRGQPVFHDAIKFWSCCSDKKCFDFEEFMQVPGCVLGYHDDGEIDIGLLQTA